MAPPPVPVAVGGAVSVPVILNGGVDVASVPLQITYDSSKLALVQVNSGDLLGKDGQAESLVHTDDVIEGSPNMHTITIADSRPPGVAGISGSGQVCVLVFQAKASGASDLVITRPGALDSAQRPIPASAQPAHIVIQ
jgi:general secretion pathway protein D